MMSVLSFVCLVGATGFQKEVAPSVVTREVRATVGGIAVALLAVNSKAQDFGMQDGWRDRTWTPSGEKYTGPDVWSTGNTWFKDQPEIRFVALSFGPQKVESPGRPIEMFGYVPGCVPLPADLSYQNQHGDKPFHAHINSDYGLTYRIPVNVGSNKVASYRLGIASGKWKVIYEDKDFQMSQDHLFGSATTESVVASGRWGSLKLISASGMRRSHHLLVPTAFPPSQSFFVELDDGTSKDSQPSKLGDCVSSHLFLQMQRSDPRNHRLRVWARPFEYIEFQGVHFEPNF